MTEKPLIIKGPVADLADLVRITRVEGRKVLRVKKVIIKPFVVPYGNDSYMVVVEPDGSGCSKASDVGGRRKT